MTQTTHRPDNDLKNAIVAELAWTPNVNGTHIGVAVLDGAVTLSGEVDSYPEKRQAEMAAQRVRGVTSIAEDITVRSTWGEVNDTDIAREASEALQRAVDVPTGSVKAAVRDHVIDLTGTVAWQFEREAAIRSVRYLKGVKSVYNTIMVRPHLPVPVSATEIKNSINGALVRHAQAETKHTKVIADAHGAVTLEGTVGSWSER